MTHTKFGIVFAIVSLLCLGGLFLTASSLVDTSGATWLDIGLVGGAGLAGIFLLLLPGRTALMVSFFLIMLAITKFRERDPWAVLAGNIDANNIYELVLYGIILMIALWNIRFVAIRRLKLGSMGLLLLGYISLSLVSALWSPNSLVTLGRATELAILFVLSFVAVRLLKPQLVLRTLTVSVVVYVLVFALAAVVFPWADGTEDRHTGYPRFSWFDVHPIEASTFAATAVVLIIGQALFAEGSPRRMLGLPVWVYGIPLFLVLIATGSRASLIACLVAAAVLGIQKSLNPRPLPYLASMLLAAVLVVGSGFYLSDEVRQILTDVRSAPIALLTRGEPEDTLTLSGRTELWRLVLDRVLERPVLGHGYVASRSTFLELLPWAGTAHNALGETLLNLGIVGTFLIWFPLGTTFLSSLVQTYRTTPALGWHHACIFGLSVFLLVNAIANESFGGQAGFDVLLLFVSVLAQDEPNSSALERNLTANASLLSHS